MASSLNPRQPPRSMTQATPPPRRTTIEAAAAQLRDLALSAEEGALLGSEEDLVIRLGVSRSTVRQVARLLEREGLLRVRRGINGGYFAARPDLHTIESTVSGYLNAIDIDPEDVTVVASVLWVEVMRKAAALRSPAAREMADRFRKKVLAISPAASFEDVLAIEQETRSAIFSLTQSRYIELIFQINTAFARDNFQPSSAMDDSAAHRAFVQNWRDCKLLELGAIADGDEQLAVMAARHIRNIWHRRVWAARNP